ncbi:Protein of unknown function [Cotesia congregata]|uniref:CCHC-type domain-containing protein n=1 Tax=Cotesia congregata TaxID=51543 RepID=A0A8J2HQG4_COTCN|nr:Protein of unknown function [Cotesia congregata]
MRNCYDNNLRNLTGRLLINRSDDLLNDWSVAAIDDVLSTPKPPKSPNSSRKKKTPANTQAVQPPVVEDLSPEQPVAALNASANAFVPRDKMGQTRPFTIDPALRGCCFNCGQPGHLRAACPSPPRTGYCWTYGSVDCTTAGCPGCIRWQQQVAAVAALPLPDIFDIDIEPSGPVNQISDAAKPEPYVHRPVTDPDDPCRLLPQCNPDERTRIFREFSEEVSPTKIDENDRRPFVDVQIGERTIKALLDTGASVTCIKEVDERNWVYGLGARVRPTNKKTAAVADGSVMAIHALVTLPLVINNEMRPVEVRVIPKLNYEMILSMDAIAAFEICYD